MVHYGASASVPTEGQEMAVLAGRPDELGDRMKAYEAVETARRLPADLPIYARIDGRSFSRFTRGMARPFERRMTDAMIEVAAYLVDQTHARIGYVQSDEISLIWLRETPESETFFGGKPQKMASVLASMAAAKMAQAVRDWQPYEARLPHFDARVLSMPSPDEAANMILWRCLDATKNAKSMACRALYSAREMHGKGQREMLEMIAAKGVDFDALPEAFRLGTFLRRVTRERAMTDAECMAIPVRHRPEPGALVLRSAVEVVPCPPFQTVADRTAFIFGTGAS